VVREAQELVELLLKAVLRSIAWRFLKFTMWGVSWNNTAICFRRFFKNALRRSRGFPSCGKKES
jgi:hypothetical protein